MPTFDDVTGEIMSEHTDSHADAGQHDFDREVRGYSRRQVDERLAQLTIESRRLQDDYSRVLDDNERLKLELSAARQAATDKPAHEEISERIGQILKLADDEARAQRSRVSEELTSQREDAEQAVSKLRTEAKEETDKSRAEAQEQAERMLGAAQEQAETTVASAKAEAEKARNSARTEADQQVAEATKRAESTVATAKAQAKQQLDEATARATAIHDGAERRLNLLMSRHTEAIRRLTEIRDVVTTLVAGEADRGSLEDEVARLAAGTMSAQEAKGAPVPSGANRPAAEGRHAGEGQPHAGAQPPAGAQSAGTQSAGTQSAGTQSAGTQPGGTQPGGAQQPAANAGAQQAPAQQGQAAHQPATGGAQPTVGQRPGSQPAGRPDADAQRARPGATVPAARPGNGVPAGDGARHAATTARDASDETDTSDSLRAISE
jgi:cell division septum initiation protein DivIVA